MQRLYRRDPNGQREATELVVCPTCRTLLEWPTGYKLPTCYHAEDQDGWRGYRSPYRRETMAAKRQAAADDDGEGS